MGENDNVESAAFCDLATRLFEKEVQRTITQKLPKRALEFHSLAEKCSEISCIQKDCVRPPEKLAQLVDEARPVLVGAASELHLVESKLRGMTADVKLSAEVLISEKLGHSLSLTAELREKVEAGLSLVNKFHNDRIYYLREMLRHPVAEYDLRVHSTLQLELEKCRNLCIVLQRILAENLEHMTDNCGFGRRNGSNHHFYAG